MMSNKNDMLFTFTKVVFPEPAIPITIHTIGLLESVPNFEKKSAAVVSDN